MAVFKSCGESVSDPLAELSALDLLGSSIVISALFRETELIYRSRRAEIYINRTRTAHHPLSHQRYHVA